MRKLTSRVVIAGLTLALGVGLSQALNMLGQHPQPIQQTPPCATPTPTPAQPAQVREEVVEYPETSGLTPWEITAFIENNQRTNLKRLWERLRVKTDPAFSFDLSSCEGCRAESSFYDLDNEPGDEALVKISNELGEAYRYLVFKHGDKPEVWKLLGHVDAWGKYRDSQALVLVSGGSNWIVIIGQSSSGSGVAYYNARVFEVAPRRLHKVADYESEGYQSGNEGFPSKTFMSRIISCDKDGASTTIVVEFKTNYSTSSSTSNDTSLFSKRQKAVFVTSAGGSPRLDTEHSTVSQRELDHIYVVDAMTDVDFLQYNYAELVELARHGNKAQRMWLKSYLKEVATDSEQQRKLTALVK